MKLYVVCQAGISVLTNIVREPFRAHGVDDRQHKARDFEELHSRKDVRVEGGTIEAGKIEAKEIWEIMDKCMVKQRENFQNNNRGKLPVEYNALRRIADDWLDVSKPETEKRLTSDMDKQAISQANNVIEELKQEWLKIDSDATLYNLCSPARDDPAWEADLSLNKIEETLLSCPLVKKLGLPNYKYKSLVKKNLRAAVINTAKIAKRDYGTEYEVNLRSNILNFIFLKDVRQGKTNRLQNMPFRAELVMALLVTDTFGSRAAAQVLKDLFEGKTWEISCPSRPQGKIEVCLTVKNYIMEHVGLGDSINHEGFVSLIERLQEIDSEASKEKDERVYVLSSGYKSVIPYMAIYAQLNKIEAIMTPSADLIKIRALPIAADQEKSERYSVYLNDPKLLHKSNPLAEEMISDGLLIQNGTEYEITPFGKIFKYRYQEQTSRGYIYEQRLALWFATQGAKWSASNLNEYVKAGFGYKLLNGVCSETSSGEQNDGEIDILGYDEKGNATIREAKTIYKVFRDIDNIDNQSIEPDIIKQLKGYTALAEAINHQQKRVHTGIFANLSRITAIELYIFATADNPLLDSFRNNGESSQKLITAWIDLAKAIPGLVFRIHHVKLDDPLEKFLTSDELVIECLQESRIPVNTSQAQPILGQSPSVNQPSTNQSSPSTSDTLSSPLPKTVKSSLVPSPTPNTTRYLELFVRQTNEHFISKKGANRFVPHQGRLDSQSLLDLIKRKREFAVAALNPNGTCSFIVFDIDINQDFIRKKGAGGKPFTTLLGKTLELAQTLRNKLSTINAYIEFSGFKGYHVWVFWHDEITLIQQKAFSGNLLAGIDIPDDLHIERFPICNDDRKIRLPLSYHSANGEQSRFIEAGESAEEQLAYVATIKCSRCPC